jgi:cytochrome c biogenesis protein CcmG/thiol:disulfide interchange protein DsbE
MTDTTIHVTPETEAAAPQRSGVAHWGRLLAWVAVLGLLALTGWGLWHSRLTQVASGASPDFTLTQFDGQTFRLSDQHGKVVVINFWASWCLPCRQEAPALEATWRAYRDRGVVFVGVDYVDTDAEARRFMAEFDNTYPNGPDLGTRISQLYRIKGVPETYFVNAKGDLRGVIIGPTTEAELQHRIDALLLDQPA